MTSEISKEVAARLTSLQVGQGLTIEEIARQTGLSVRVVTAKLAGEREINAADLDSFASALGTKPSILCEGF